jgi:hypothetical protein
VIVEYASIVAAVAMLTTTLSAHGQKVAALPTSAGAAIQLVNSNARAQHVSAAAARAAYKRAPYRRPVLKYLYTAGWIGGTKQRASCIYVLGTTKDAQREAVSELRRNTKVARQLQRLQVPLRIGAAALVKGLASACS